MEFKTKEDLFATIEELIAQNTMLQGKLETIEANLSPSNPEPSDPEPSDPTDDQLESEDEIDKFLDL